MPSLTRILAPLDDARRWLRRRRIKRQIRQMFKTTREACGELRAWRQNEHPAATPAASQDASRTPGKE